MNGIKRYYYAFYNNDSSVNKMANLCPEAYIYGWGIIENYVTDKRMRFKKSSKKSYIPVTVWNFTEEDIKSLKEFVNVGLLNQLIISVKLIEVNEVVAQFSVRHYHEEIEAFIYVR